MFDGGARPNHTLLRCRHVQGAHLFSPSSLKNFPCDSIAMACIPLLIPVVSTFKIPDCNNLRFDDRVAREPLHTCSFFFSFFLIIRWLSSQAMPYPLLSWFFLYLAYKSWNPHPHVVQIEPIFFGHTRKRPDGQETIAAVIDLDPVDQNSDAAAEERGAKQMATAV